MESLMSIRRKPTFTRMRSSPRTTGAAWRRQLNESARKNVRNMSSASGEQIDLAEVSHGALLDVGAAYGTFIAIAARHYECTGLDVSAYATSWLPCLAGSLWWSLAPPLLSLPFFEGRNVFGIPTDGRIRADSVLPGFPRVSRRRDHPALRGFL